LGASDAFSAVIYAVFIFSVLGFYVSPLPSRILFMSAQKTSKHTLVCAAVLSCFAVFGATQIIAAAVKPGSLNLPAGLTALREGKTTQTLEKQLDHNLPVRPAAIALANAVRYKLFGAGGEQVTVGRNEWLFLTEELMFDGPGVKGSVNNPDLALKARVELIGELGRLLQSQGVNLVVALVPDKARVYSQFLHAQKYPSYNETRFADALAGLRNKKVNTIDLLTPMVKAAGTTQLYYRTDTHWNQNGSQIAAQEIAKAISEIKDKEKLDIKRVKFSSTVSGVDQERSGDLTRLMGLDIVPNAFRPAPDIEAAEVTSEVASEVSAKDSAPGLFDDSGVGVVLAGTSYSLRANFHGKLQYQLSTQVLNTAKDGGGFLQAMTAYLKDDAFKTAKPKVLVWEIPERMLRRPIDQERDWLNQIKPSLK
jgi:alginate O-acetyltransferase complex protein AlgJ